ncbi:MFS transporter [Nonomuraea sp. NPDC050556]|uniref:MFS transporter n=1 Tax=Nonomuraea sp. NPDC050556 TaxID=3364369 RepID=UPI0037A7AFF8
MMTVVSPALRLLRAAVFAVACVLVTAGGHLFAGGSAVPAGVIFAAGAGALGMAYGLNGRELGRGTILALTTAAQACLHALFAWAAPASAVYSAHGHLKVGMVLVHLTAALLTGWWLHRGESALWLLLRLWGAAPLTVLAWLLGDELVVRVRHAVPARTPDSCSPWDRQARLRLRGPPVRPKFLFGSYSAGSPRCTMSDVSCWRPSAAASC